MDTGFEGYNGQDAERESPLLQPFTPSEVGRIIDSLPNGKACGNDDIPNEFLKCLGTKSRNLLTCFFNDFLRQNNIPISWKTTSTKLIYKGKGKDPTLIESYRPIALLSNVYKLYCKIIKQRLNAFLIGHQSFGSLQFGFRPGRNVNDNLYLLTNMIELAYKHNQQLYVALLDIKGAYDNVNRDILWQRLHTFSLPKPIIQHLREMYKEANIEYTWNEVKTPPVPSQIGLRQGCPLSSTLFALYLRPLEDHIRASSFGVKISPTKTCPGIFYADDVGITAETPNTLQQHLDICSTFGDENDLSFSEEKSVIIAFNASTDQVNTFHLQGKEIPQASRATYLGVEICNENPNYLKYEYERRINKAQRLKGIIKHSSRHAFSRYEVARALWKQVAVPALTYAAESLSLPDNLWQHLDKAQLEIGRYALGANHISPNICIEGEMGWSPFHIRNTRAKNCFEGKILHYEEEDLVKIMYTTTCAQANNTKWQKHIWKSRMKYNIETNIQKHTTQKAWRTIVKQNVNAHNEARWSKEVKNKQSLTYYEHKKKPNREFYLDNSLGSDLLFQARTGSLPTAARHNKIFGTPPTCPGCFVHEETLGHIIYECSALTNNRRNILQIEDTKPSQHSEEEIAQLLLLSDETDKHRESTIKFFLEDWWRTTKRKPPYWR